MAEMKLVGSKYTKIYGSRKKDFSGKISMKTGIIIGKVEKVKEAKDTLEVEYRFHIDYGELGKIEMEGSLYITGDQKTLKELQKDSKERDMSNSEFVAITNLVLQKASVKSFELEEELGLPIHIRLPTINPSK